MNDLALDHQAIIVGAGFGGIGAGIELKRQGISDLAILEREDDLGGTWHVNHYPGLAVDIASVTYSYSFEPNPNWTRLFAPGAELKKYAEHVADTYDLRRHMEFGVTVERAEWDDAGFWTVHTTDGASRTAQFLVTATGFLSQPYTPDFPGIESFAGDVIHTTAWQDGYDFAGRRAAVIGTGATAVQLIPEIAKSARHLTVFQRTPIWVVPKVDFPIPAPIRRLFGAVPATQRAARAINTSMLELLMVVGVLHYRQAKPGNRLAALLAKAHMRAQVRDANTRRQLTPAYDFGCKRPTFSNTYFPVFNQPDVDLETSSIVRVEADGIVVEGEKKIPVDTLVLATGFNLWDVNFPAFQVIGRDGRDLGKWWRDGRFQAYEGVAVPKFPNFLTLNSPYSYSGLSYFTTIEGQMRHIARLFGELRKRGADRFEVTEQANSAYLDKSTERLGDSVFYAGDCASSRSYYFNQHGEATLLRPQATLSTLREMENFPLDDYTYA
ncbi:Predicted flavoprotein CzcO associated with the cation diffusion facilitator CzcD [Gordonia malaquae]|uniref:Putative flavin-containing monooxygenase n=1 Tax=Gordonia malaquae NBRC 108250 TaxID=1223542 RepID=M3US52_GORML|nr:NAD(P)/FAD-dependent oxidoreductase [Gordonia malaquae]GAC78052.1 putative flavin-containing monooxygenase [Gordonia malaquae NBRC 108250]SED90793.1 Predicted flavoprotein CzcO associated with the cation diffusion facilitator CzcD [Gordonia malaquae]